MADLLLINLLSSRLDFLSFRDFLFQRATTEFPTLEEFITFMTQRCQALEVISLEDHKSSISTHKSTSNMAVSPGKSDTASTKGKKCLFCDKNNHFISSCFQFKKCEPDERRRSAERLKLCFLCLSSNHRVSECRRTDLVCTFCQKKHNSLLHFDVCKESVERRDNEGSKVSVSPEPSVSLSVKNKHDMLCHMSLLPTALGYVVDGSGSSHQCRILMDIGSQKNYVTAEFVNRLEGCQSSPVQFSVEGVGGHTTSVTHKINFIIRSRISGFKINSDFGVLNTITECLPIHSFSKRLVRWPSHVKLADPNFNVSSKVDIILGANEFFVCLKSGKINLRPGLPGLLNTEFGWIMCGNLSLSDRLSHSMRKSVCNLAVVHSDITCFRELENILNKNMLSLQHRECEKSHAKSYTRDSSGRYQVDLPVRFELLSESGDSNSIFHSRFLLLDRRFVDCNFYKAYRSFIHENSSVRALSLNWEPHSDEFQVVLPNNLLSKNHEKGNIVRIFDTLGYLSPVITFIKLILQLIWKKNINLHDRISDSILCFGRSFCKDWHCLKFISIPRLGFQKHLVNVELHGVVDSSTKANGGVLHAHYQSSSNLYTVHLICAKRRVAPLKLVTLPRSELLAAFLVARLMENVSKVLNTVNKNNCFLLDGFYDYIL
jgi:hypothetical protein